MKIIKKVLKKVNFVSKPKCPNCQSTNTTYLHTIQKNLCFDCEHTF